MAFLKVVQRSPFWYIRYRDLETGAWRDKGTKYRRDQTKDSRAARRLADQLSAKEHQVGPSQGETFAAWVPAYLKNHYGDKPTGKRMQFAWESILRFLRETGIRHPREVKYHHAEEFVAWRKSTAGMNTVRLELKFFSFLLSEAIRREFAERNVLAQFRMGRVPAQAKADITEAQILTAREAFQARPRWMQIVFEIMLHLGCRFGESSIPLERIDFDQLTITMVDSKRNETDPRKFFTIPLPAQLAEYLRPLRDQERTVPILTGAQNMRFNQALKAAIGCTSHSLRVQFITRCFRDGLNEKETMRLVNHSSRLVNQIYTRLSVKDAHRSRARVSLPPAPVPLRPADIPGSR